MENNEPNTIQKESIAKVNGKGITRMAKGFKRILTTETQRNTEIGLPDGVLKEMDNSNIRQKEESMGNLIYVLIGISGLLVSTHFTVKLSYLKASTIEELNRKIDYMARAILSAILFVLVILLK